MVKEINIVDLSRFRRNRKWTKVDIDTTIDGSGPQTVAQFFNPGSAYVWATDLKRDLEQSSMNEVRRIVIH